MGNPSANFEVPEINLISMEFDKIPTWKSPTIIYRTIVKQSTNYSTSYTSQQI